MKKTVSDQELLSIGDIALSLGVSENCIRRMEAAGLVRPAYVATESGYRYYSGSEIAQISTVLTLRSFGFTNKDIDLFVKNPDNLAILYHKLENIRQNVTSLLLQLDRRLKNDAPYKCEVFSFSAFFCYTREVLMVPRLAVFSEIAEEMLFETITKKLPIDYTRSLLIETDSKDFRTFDPAAEIKLLFHIPLRDATPGPDISLIPQIKAVDVKWSYPGADYSAIVPIIEQYFDLFGFHQTGTLRATFDMGNHAAMNAGISNTVMHILIPIG